MSPKTLMNVKLNHPFLNDLKGVSDSYFAESALGLSGFPYLADHAFQGMVVLPGAVYLEMALAIIPVLGNGYTTIKNVHFQNLCILPTSGVETLFLSLSPGKENTATFQCYSCVKDGHETIHASMFALQENSITASKFFDKFKINEIQENSFEEVDGKEFYSGLRGNGNQYGPDFQGVEKFWIGDEEILASIALPGNLKSESSAYHFHPALLDCCTHALCATIRQVKQTFVLTGIAKVIIYGSAENVCWSYACRTARVEQNEKNLLVGNIYLLDESGNVVMELLGVKFQYIEYENQDLKSTTKSANPIVVSSTFTAEPLADSLDFWQRTLKLPFKTQFAPYNQIFQQLLDASSETALNKNGMNVILIRLADWVGIEDGAEITFSNDNKEHLLAKRLRHILPNELEITHLNEYETDYLYKEIFVDQCYMRHGIEIHDGDCVIDIGANIGMFSLFVQQNYKDTKIYAFEPAPPVFELLDINTKLYGSNVSAFNFGVSDRTKVAEFTFYEKSSVFSGFVADKADDERSVRAVIRNMLQDSCSLEADDTESVIDGLMEDRLNQKSYTCQLKSLSNIIRENSIKEIDLLKIDAEKSELAILKGIEGQHWQVIKQIVIEIHDKKGAVIDETKQLLKEKGFNFEIEEEQLLQASGLYNIYATRSAEDNTGTNSHSSFALKERSVAKNANDFLVALKSSLSKNLSVPYLICFCPASPQALQDSRTKELFRQTEEYLLSELTSLNQVYSAKSSEAETAYQIEDFYDFHGDKLGHVPYTPVYFSALGSLIVRKYFALQSAPSKVVVLDCDNTLWKGILGEDGADGVEVEPPYKKLQEFMVQQSMKGMLICLCSKNVEEDVVEVFRLRDEMLLKRHHIVSWRINWLPKSENIKSLAEELQLGLDSFIFIDDNPVECAEVEANCPEVLTLLLPNEPGEIPRFLSHVWAFDRPKITGEDARRTTLYQANLQREAFRKESMSLEKFLTDLELKIEISTPAAKDIPRVSQLTYRTNQFNLTTIRRSESEISKLARSGAVECLIAKVSDRFGDYGIVGVILFETESDTMIVDTFLLSCRVLGRGVEYRMLARLGELAYNRKLHHVLVDYLPTYKNEPALVFLNGLGVEFKNKTEEGFQFKFPVSYAKKVTYEPHSGDSKSAEAANAIPENTARKPDALLHSQLISRIANDYCSAEKILGQIESHNSKQRPDLETEFVTPGNDLERSVASVWQKILGISKIGVYDNFSDIGGTSLKGIELIALLKRELNMDVSIVDLFEYPNISSMAKMLANKSVQGKQEIILKSRNRGERRRVKRRVRVK